MSHASAEFIFKDGTILYGEYNGTSNVMLSNMFNTYDEMLDKWREQEWRGCECPGEPCVAMTNYADGEWWVGIACRKHMCFKEPMMTSEDDRLWKQVGESPRNEVHLVYQVNDDYSPDAPWRILAKNVLEKATLENIYDIPDVENIMDQYWKFWQ
jgi:hypothetical protein